VSAKRYRYTGKERDEETGLYYHGARYYAPWLGRWTAADPAGMVDGPNLYEYVRGNPVRLNDPSGTQGEGQRQEIPVSVRPKGAPENLARWSFGPGPTAFITDAAAFAERSEGRPIFVYDPERASPEANALMARVQLEADIQSVGEALRASGEGTQAQTSRFAEAVERAEVRAGTQGGSLFSQQLALGAGILTQQLGEDITATEGTSPYGIVGGRNVGAESTQELQAAASLGQILAGAAARLAGKLIKRGVEAVRALRQAGSIELPSDLGLGVGKNAPTSAAPLELGPARGGVATRGSLPGPTVDRATGQQVGRFVVDQRGNAMIEPVGGTTVPAGRGGVDTHTLYPNASNYQRLNPHGHPGNPTPHGHGHRLGTGPGKRGQGPSIDPEGNVVPWNSGAAHWPIN
jgi:RHS repeat-associated protein